MDTISRQAAINALDNIKIPRNASWYPYYQQALTAMSRLPSAQPTIYGYNVEHLEMIARVLQKENLPPERVVEILIDIGRIVAIVCDEFEDNLRKAVEQCMT